MKSTWEGILASIFDRCWWIFGAKLGGKIEPRSMQKGIEKTIGKRTASGQELCYLPTHSPAGPQLCLAALKSSSLEKLNTENLHVKKNKTLTGIIKRPTERLPTERLQNCVNVKRPTERLNAETGWLWEPRHALGRLRARCGSTAQQSCEPATTLGY